MKLLPRLWIAISLAIGATPASPQVSSLKGTLQIGTVLGVARPEGFAVEDRRSADAKVASEFTQTYKAPFNPFMRVPVAAKYERNLGDGELNVAAVDLLAEKLIERYGDQLRGKRLTVHEFSYRLEQRIPHSMNVAGTELLQDRGINLALKVKIEAELDGQRVEAVESPTTLAGAGAPARITLQALEKFLYRLEQQLEPPPVEPSSLEANVPEDKKPD